MIISIGHSDNAAHSSNSSTTSLQLPAIRVFMWIITVIIIIPSSQSFTITTPPSLLSSSFSFLSLSSNCDHLPIPSLSLSSSSSSSHHYSLVAMFLSNNQNVENDDENDKHGEELEDKDDFDSSTIRNQSSSPQQHEEPQQESPRPQRPSLSPPPDQVIVTKEMLLRDMLRDPNATGDQQVTVQHKISKNKKGGKKSPSSYKVYDNRDIMPFAVTLQTPDPYTHPEIKKSRAAKPKKIKKAAIEEQVTSRIVMPSSSSSSNNNYETLLGEYTLDKHTTTGDILCINEIQYKVIRHRCQYKYVGGQRFIMIKKILEVKEISRLITEEYLNKLIV